MAPTCVYLLVILSAQSLVITAYDCPLPWMTFQDKCYKFSETSASLDTAALDCAKDGASLLSVNSRDEDAFITEHLRARGEDYNWWTSGRRRVSDEMSFFWEGDSSEVRSFQNWALDVGDLQGDIIVYFDNNGVWGWRLDTPHSNNMYVCEISRAEVYRIVSEIRDFDYGIMETDPALVHKGPHFLKQPQDFVYDVESVERYVSFVCVADGNPNPDFEWYRKNNDGVFEAISLLGDAGQHYTKISGKLIIHNPDDKTDNGDYYCTASNIYGTIRSISALLTFGYLLDFPKSNRDPVTVMAYAGAGIECNPPKHYPNVLYSWYKNNTMNFVTSKYKPYVFVSLGGKLYFSSATRDDIGEYYCHVVSPRAKVTSAAGRVSRPIPLLVLESIASIREPNIASGFPGVYPGSPLKGDNIVIECFAWGTGDLVYSWERIDGRMPQRAYTKDYDRTLNIDNVQMDDSGTYRCHVSRQNGQSDWEDVVLSVESKPYAILPLRDEHVDAGGDITLRCIVGGKPRPQYAWYRDGVLLTWQTLLADERERMTLQENELVITGVQDRDAAMYQCAGINIYGMNLTSAQLRVLAFPPTFSKQPLEQRTYGTVRGNATIICHPEASPRADISWRKDGRDLAPGSEETSRLRLLPNGNLRISRLTQADEGVYTCLAENKYGTDSSSGNLTILPELRIYQLPRTSVVALNSTAFIPCQVSHSPQLDVTYVWYQNGRPIDFLKVIQLGNTWDIIRDPHFYRGEGMNSGALFIRDVQFYHAGFYMCEVHTYADTISAETSLTVYGPPVRPAGVQADRANSTAMRVFWVTYGTDSGRPVTSYIIEGFNDHEQMWRDIQNFWVQPRKPNNETVVGGLSPWSTYQFRVRAINDVGSSDPSDPSPEYTTQPDVPMVAPRNVRGGGGKVGTLTIQWDPLPLVERNGPLMSYRMYWKRSNLIDDEWSTWYYSPEPLDECKKDNLERECDNVDEEVAPLMDQYVRSLGEAPENIYARFDVMVQAFNELGDGPLSDVITIRSAEGLPSSVVENVRVWHFNETSLKVTWRPVPDTIANIKGVLKGYRINYWKQFTEDETRAIYRPLEGQRSEGLILGLENRTYYWVNVQVFNTAGVGPKSQPYLERTLRRAPLDQPTEVKVRADGPNSIFIHFRGVSTAQYEEPLQGYMARYWPAGGDYADSMHIDFDKKTYGRIGGLSQNQRYNLRVFGYSRGGEGRASSPTIQFELGPNCRVLEQDPERRFVYTCHGCLSQSPSLQLLVLAVILVFVHHASSR